VHEHRLMFLAVREKQDMRFMSDVTSSTTTKPFKTVFTSRHTSFITKNLHSSNRVYICDFFVYLRTTSEYFPIQHELIGLKNWMFTARYKLNL
jgi:hypothetical protein